MGEELWNVGKVLGEEFDLLIYSRKVGRQQIGSLSQEDRPAYITSRMYIWCFVRYLYSPWKEIYW